MTGKPANDRVGFLGGIRIQHGTDLQAGLSAILSLFEDGEELLVGVSDVATAPGLAGGSSSEANSETVPWR